MKVLQRSFVAIGVVGLLSLASLPSDAQTTEVTEVTGSAFAANIAVTIVGGPALAFGPEPFVELAPDASNSPQADSLLSLNLSDIIVSDTLNAETSGALGPEGFVESSSSVEDFFFGAFETAFLSADVIESSCRADLEGVTGTTNLAEASAVDGTLAIPVSPAPNTVIDSPDPALTLTLNRQVENADGSLEVTALVLEIETQGISGTIELAQSVCGVVGETEVVPPGPVAAEPVFTG